jgi:hypothetical protein
MKTPKHVGHPRPEMLYAGEDFIMERQAKGKYVIFGFLTDEDSTTVIIRTEYVTPPYVSYSAEVYFKVEGDFELSEWNTMRAIPKEIMSLIAKDTEKHHNDPDPAVAKPPEAAVKSDE